MKVIFPFSAVRQLLIQKEMGEKREKWATAMQEYDIEIRPTKIIRGKGIYRLLSRASNISDDEESVNTVHIAEVSMNDSESQYNDLIFYLKMDMLLKNSIINEKEI